MGLPESRFERPDPADYSVRLDNGLVAYVARADQVPRWGDGNVVAGTVVYPGHQDAAVPTAVVESVLNDNTEDNNPDADTYFRERLSWSLGILKGYAEALTPMRETVQVHHDKFGNGM